MDLIVKFNTLCNFHCTFCSTPYVVNSDTLDIEVLKKVLIQNKVENLIINGGDPLLVHPGVYRDLIKFIHSNNMDIKLGMTTNLWDFYLRTEKWEELFTQQIVPVTVTTSFQYGDERRITKDKVFTEDIFREVLGKFKNVVGYTPTFIAVINENNSDKSIKHVELAKELGTMCRVNGMSYSGRADTMYPFYRMWNIWLDIINQGLSSYEINSQIIQKVWKGEQGQCPFLSNCDDNILCLSTDGLTRCGALSDDINKLSNHADILGYVNRNRKAPYELTTIKHECYECEFYKVCNSCHKRIFDIKSTLSVEKHCKGMKALLRKTRAILG